MPQETPRHLKAPPPEAFDVDLFTGEFKDPRTKDQKKEAFNRQFKQPLMFRTPEISQFGVNPHPLLPITEKTRLGLEMFDPRTDEEKARDTDLEAQKRTLQLFPPEAPSTSLPQLLTAGATSLLPAQCLTTEQEVQRRAMFERHQQQFEWRVGEQRQLLRILYRQESR